MNGNRKENDFVKALALNSCYHALARLGGTNEADSDEKLYHYTSAKVLNAILSHGIFRASNLFYLNDKIEYKMGIEILKKIFEQDSLLLKYIEEIRNLNGREWAGVYSISFSNKADELQQWITYARESGVCIELNSDIVLKQEKDLNKIVFKLGIKSGEHSYQYYNGTCLLKLAYEKGDLASTEKSPQLDANKIRYAFAKAIYDDCNGVMEQLDEREIQTMWEKESNLAKSFLELLSAYYKEERFRGEGEIRAAFLPTKNSEDSPPTIIKYFEQENGTLRPYMDVYFMHDYHDGNPYKIECPIKSITVGPGGNQDNVFDSIVHRIEYGESKVWNYTETELAKLLADFVFGCIQQYKEDISIDLYGKIAEQLISLWCEKSGFDFRLKEATKIGVSLELFKSTVKTEKGKDEKESEIEKSVKSFLENNYFSTKGIWIRKSSVSYIF